MSSDTWEPAPLAFTPVFIVGAPRSGTTWVQSMLGAHPEICAPQETGLFHTYLSAWNARWSQELAESSRPNARRRGLPAVLTKHQFLALLRRTAVEIYTTALDAKPSAFILVDKEPTNSEHVELIETVFPESRMVHVVRDGRDVAASLVAASSSWASDWAPRSVAAGAATWRDHVAQARKAAGLPCPYLEVSYEALLDDTTSEITRLFRFVGADADEQLCRAISKQFTFEEVQGRASASASGIAWAGELSLTGPMSEPAGFYRQGKMGTWRSVWSKRQRGEFDRVAGKLLVELGYESSRGWWDPGAGARLLQAAAGAKSRLVEHLKGGIRAWVARHPSLQSG